MEITYDEHEDNDIDINIDIDQENQDEDYMIEDAKSEAETADDVMADEDDISYQMEDDDFMPDHPVEEVGVAPAAEITEVEMLRSSEPEPVTEDLPMESTAQDEDLDFDNQPTADVTHSDDHNLEDSGHDEHDAADKPAPEVDSHHNVEKAENNPDAVQSEAADDAADQEASHFEEQSDALVVSAPTEFSKKAQDIHRNVDEGGKLKELVSRNREVVVRYNDAEYWMVALDPSDDPDSYFLKDVALLKEPMTTLFATIRDVLSGEVNAEDELSLIFEDLDIEANEVRTMSDLVEACKLTISRRAAPVTR